MIERVMLQHPGEAMRDARLEAGWSLRKLSKESGVTVTCICDYENGRHDPPLMNLLRLANALEISLDEYVGRD